MSVAAPIHDPYAGFCIVRPERWDAAQCARMAQRVARDRSMGTPYPFRGAVPELPVTTRFNGGCVENGEWYVGRHYSLPILAAGFRWAQVPTWCWRIVAEPVMPSAEARAHQA